MQLGMQRFPMISWTRSKRVGDQSHQLPRIPLLDEIGACSPARGSKLGWLISEGIQGERHVFELKLRVEMPSRTDERHNVCTLYWSRGGVRPLSIVDSADVRTCLVSSKYGRKIIEGAFTLGMHLCGSCVLYLHCWRGTEDWPRNPCEVISHEYS